jgi:hypothetical protein
MKMPHPHTLVGCFAIGEDEKRKMKIKKNRIPHGDINGGEKTSRKDTGTMCGQNPGGVGSPPGMLREDLCSTGPTSGDFWRL